MKINAFVLIACLITLLFTGCAFSAEGMAETSAPDEISGSVSVEDATVSDDAVPAEDTAVSDDSVSAEDAKVSDDVDSIEDTAVSDNAVTTEGTAAPDNAVSTEDAAVSNDTTSTETPIISADTGAESENDAEPSMTARSMQTKDIDEFDYWLYTPAEPSEGMPLIVYLHGGSGKGDDLNLITEAGGFPAYLRDGMFGDLCAYVVIPQLPADMKGWSDAAALKGVRIRVFVGADDTIVPPESSERFADVLTKAGEDVQITVFDGAGHFDVPELAYLDPDIGLVSWLAGND